MIISIFLFYIFVTILVTFLKVSQKFTILENIVKIANGNLFLEDQNNETCAQ